MANYSATLQKEEWLVNLRDAGERYKCEKTSIRTTVMRFLRGHCRRQKCLERKHKKESATTREKEVIGKVTMTIHQDVLLDVSCTP